MFVVNITTSNREPMYVVTLGPCGVGKGERERKMPP